MKGLGKKREKKERREGEEEGWESERGRVRETRSRTFKDQSLLNNSLFKKRIKKN